MAKVANMIKSGKLVEQYRESATDDAPAYVSYAEGDDYRLVHDGEEVISVDVHDNGVVWVTTVQGREHIGEFEYNAKDNIPIRSYKAC